MAVSGAASRAGAHPLQGARAACPGELPGGDAGDRAHAPDPRPFRRDRPPADRRPDLRRRPPLRPRAPVPARPPARLRPPGQRRAAQPSSRRCRPTSPPPSRRPAPPSAVAPPYNRPSRNQPPFDGEPDPAWRKTPGPGKRGGIASPNQGDSMPEAGLNELLQAGVHFGHQTRRWNPNMRRFIFGELDGIHIIDLLQTEALLENARRFAGELASGGGTVLFVGTKKQARDTVQEWADRCKMPYVNKRWLGGLLTNFNTMSTADRPPARAQRLERGRQTRPAADQGADGHGGRTRQARVQPRRRPRHGPPARRGLRHRPQNRGDRGPRGGPPADPDHRPGRHQLRPDPGRLRDPRQRRRDPLLPAGHRHDRRRRRGGLQLLARAGGEAHRRGNGAPQKGRGRAQEARGGRESSGVEAEAAEKAAAEAEAAGESDRRSAAGQSRRRLRRSRPTSANPTVQPDVAPPQAGPRPTAERHRPRRPAKPRPRLPLSRASRSRGAPAAEAAPAAEEKRRSK